MNRYSISFTIFLIFTFFLLITQPLLVHSELEHYFIINGKSDTCIINTADNDEEQLSFLESQQGVVTYPVDLSDPSNSADYLITIPECRHCILK